MRALLLLAALLLSTNVHAAEGKLKSGAFDPPRVAPEITLDGSDGSPLRLEKFRGKLVMMGFGFTHCPEVCPTTLSKLAKVRKQLGTAGSDVQVIYVTVDPQRDKPPRMQSYLANFDPTFIGGTGTPEQLAKVFKDYGVTATKYAGPSPDVYGVDHSSFVYLIDRAGKIRAMVPYGKSVGDIAHDAAILLKQ